MLPALALLLGAALLAAGCGGSSSSSSGSSGGSAGTSASAGPYGSPSPSTSTSAETISAASSKLGRILVDGDGKTLYLFASDTPSMSSCDSACLRYWPAVTTSAAPKAGNGIMASKLGTIAGTDGKKQVTYDGHPLYWYAGDSQAGDVNGQGLDDFGALWYVLSPSGSAITS
jgi:predicted lipoprotein with Yx(FWY)xxD motif